MGRVALVAAWMAGTVGLVNTASAQAAKPDTVYRVDPRNGRVVAISGTVEQHGLERVSVARRDGQQGRYDTAEVVEVVFGDVPQSYADALRYADRGDHERAVAGFRVAAGDAATRPVVQGRARLAAAETLLAWGATDPTRFQEAASEAQRFIDSFGDDRNVPLAKGLLGRAQILSGDAAAGAATLAALFEQGQAGAAGYPRIPALEAGLTAAHAYLAAGKSAEASSMFDSLTSAVAATPRDGLGTAKVARLDGLAEVAAMGSAFVALAEKRGDRAEMGFRSALNSAQTGAGRNTAQLGLGEALLLQSKHRPAQIALASASALGYTSDDMEARALLGLARAHIALGDTASGKQALERLQRGYGATPAASQAAELMKTL